MAWLPDARSRRARRLQQRSSGVQRLLHGRRPVLLHWCAGSWHAPPQQRALPTYSPARLPRRRRRQAPAPAFAALPPGFKTPSFADADVDVLAKLDKIAGAGEKAASGKTKVLLGGTDLHAHARPTARR